MELRLEAFDDRSELGRDGTYEWAYKGVNFHFVEGLETLTFRRYEVDSQVATLIAPGGWQPSLYASVFFRAAVRLLRDQQNIQSIHVADPESGIFAPLPDEMLMPDS